MNKYNYIKPEEVYKNSYYEETARKSKWFITFGLIGVIIVYLLIILFMPTIDIIEMAILIFISFIVSVCVGYYIMTIIIPTTVSLSEEGLAFRNKFKKEGNSYYWKDIAKIDTKEVSIKEGKIVEIVRIHLKSGKGTVGQYFSPNIVEKIQRKFNEFNSQKLEIRL